MLDIKFIRENVDAVKKARPAASKGTYVRRVVVTDTMAPGIKVDPASALALEVE